MEWDLAYTAERHTAEVDAEAYIGDFRRTEYFLQFCRQCRNYGRRYGCPPLERETLDAVGRYRKVRIVGVKIIPHDRALPIEAAHRLMEPVVAEMNEELLEMERALDGQCYGFVGECPYCGGAPCARIEGKPCRHPERVRPSLEAVGFDIGRTARELLGIELKWGHEEQMPEYLTLVCGIFYDKRD